MVLNREAKIALVAFSSQFGLIDPPSRKCHDRTKKMDQIIAFVDMLMVHIGNYNRKRKLILVDAAAGNCYLGFAAYYYLTVIEKRSVEMHCVDHNAALMENNARVARDLGFEGMRFHAMDVQEFDIAETPDAVLALHACDLATDKAIYLGVRTKAKNILCVACCQHTFGKRMRSPSALVFITKNKVFKDRLTYITADTMRGLLLSAVGYNVTIVEFVSSRATDKNVMVRAERNGVAFGDKPLVEYLALAQEFGTSPMLEDYLVGGGLIPALGSTRDPRRSKKGAGVLHRDEEPKVAPGGPSWL